MTARELSADDAAALLRPVDTLAVPLGPGAPGGLLHALGGRDDSPAGGGVRGQVDTLAVPRGPGAPGGLLHALGGRDDWQALEVFGALLLDLYSVFTKP